jgi:hypothetical protein
VPAPACRFFCRCLFQEAPGTAGGSFFLLLLLLLLPFSLLLYFVLLLSPPQAASGVPLPLHRGTGILPVRDRGVSPRPAVAVASVVSSQKAPGTVVNSDPVEGAGDRCFFFCRKKRRQKQPRGQDARGTHGQDAHATGKNGRTRKDTSDRWRLTLAHDLATMSAVVRI